MAKIIDSVQFSYKYAKCLVEAMGGLGESIGKVKSEMLAVTWVVIFLCPQSLGGGCT